MEKLESSGGSLVSGARRAAALRGRGKTAFYAEIADGLMCRPIRNGQRSSAWPRAEIEAINRARIAGLGDAEIRQLVERLHAERTRGLDRLGAPDATAPAKLGAPDATAPAKAPRRRSALDNRLASRVVSVEVA